MDTIGCETQIKIRWITTINNHASYQNKINCFKLHRTVCDSYDKVTLLQTLTSKLLAFLSMCVHMSRPKGHVRPVLPSPWFKALYVLDCYTFCTRQKLQGNCTIIKLENHFDYFHCGKKKLVNEGSKNMFTKQDNSLKHCIQSITKKLRSTLSLKIETETKNTTVPFSKEDKSKYSSRVKCISRKIAWASKDFNQLGPLSPKNMVSLLSCSM